MLALLQNINNVEADECVNATLSSSNTTLSPNSSKSQPLFSVSLFFLLMSVLLSISTLSFFALNNTRFGKLERQKAKEIKSKNGSNANSASHNLDDDEIFLKENQVVDQPDAFQLRRSEVCEVTILLSMVFTTTFIGYGITPGLQTFSVLPYGARPFNLAVNLSKNSLDAQFAVT